MSESSSWNFSLTREEILRRRVERDEIAAEIGRLQSKLEQEDRWFEAISLILPAQFKATLFSIMPASDGGEATRSVWRRAIEPVISAATRGLLPKEIAQGIRDGDNEEVKERLARNPNGLYAALERMEDDGQVVRHADKVYSAALYDALSQSGDLDDDADESGLTGVGLFIAKFILENGPIRPKTLMEALRNNDEFVERVTKNPQYGYSALSRLVRQGRLVKDGALYAVPSQKNGPSGVSPPNGPDAGSSKGFFE
ncbi:hypothetical protein HPGCJGGD_2210 [Methylobacterium haplocladii]|nr:hypothetical protein HPGCJGGD_2210 [Methylobacterium haplocladii]